VLSADESRRLPDRDLTTSSWSERYRGRCGSLA